MYWLFGKAKLKRETRKQHKVLVVYLPVLHTATRHFGYLSSSVIESIHVQKFIKLKNNLRIQEGLLKIREVFSV
jgi:hypothetical protein